MSGFNNNAYSYTPGANRLIAPVNLASSANYVFQTESNMGSEATMVSVDNTAIGGSPATFYYQQATATGGGSAPNIPPSIPEVTTAPTTTTIQVAFTVAGVTGTPYPTFSILYGTTNPPTISAPAVKAAPNLAIYVATVTGLAPNTAYYFASVATNATGQKTSNVSAPITTAAGGGGTAPSAPAAPVQGATTSSSLTITFDTVDVSGTAPITFSALFGVTSTAINVPIPASLVSGTTYRATATGLNPNTPYYFKSVASNSAGQALSAAAGPFTTSPITPPTPLKTNLVTPFLIQGPRFSESSPWPGIDYYINPDAVGATANLGQTTVGGQQVFAAMYAGTIGAAGNATPGGANTPYAGSCVADQPFAALGGTSGNANYSDMYLGGVQNAMAVTDSGRVLASWGGFLADVLGLFGPYQPTGFPGTNPSSDKVVQSFLHSYCGVGAENPLGWVRTNSVGTSGYTFYYNGLILDFENVGAGNPLNNYPFAGTTPPAFPANATNPTYAPYIDQIAQIPQVYYSIAGSMFLGNAPVSLCIVADRGTTNICAPNTALNTFYPFPTATVIPTKASYNTVSSAALTHESQMCYFDDVFVQFYNEDADYYIGGQYFANLLACWGYLALKAQGLGIKKTTINIGLARGNIIPGRDNTGNFVANGQGPTPAMGAPPNASAQPPYTYWYPQYATASPPNYTAAGGWPNTSPTLDPVNLANEIQAANLILQNMTGNQNLAPSDWCSGMGFWAGPNATTSAQAVYTKGNAISPDTAIAGILPSQQTYCWSDADYPAPNPAWTGNVPIVSTL